MIQLTMLPHVRNSVYILCSERNNLKLLPQNYATDSITQAFNSLHSWVIFRETRADVSILGAPGGRAFATVNLGYTQF